MSAPHFALSNIGPDQASPAAWKLVARTSPRTALLYAQAEASNAEDARKGEAWWEEEGARNDDGTAPADYPAAGARAEGL